MVGHTALGAWQRVTQSLCLPYIVGEGSSFPGLVPSDNTVNSEPALSIKPGVMIGYQVDEFTHTWYQGVRIILFWIRLLPTLNKAWIPSSLSPLRHQNWTLPWMSLMPLHLHFLLGFFTQLVLFLIILKHNLLVA